VTCHYSNFFLFLSFSFYRYRVCLGPGMADNFIPLLIVLSINIGCTEMVAADGYNTPLNMHQKSQNIPHHHKIAL